MSEEQRSQAWEQLVAQVLAPLIGLAVTYYIGTHAASIEIELRARWARLRAAREAYEQGRRVAEWFVQAEAPKVIEAAEYITMNPEEVT